MSGLCPIVKYVVFAAIEDHFRCGWMALAPIGEWDFLNTRILAAARRRQRDAINRAGRRITMNISASNITPATGRRASRLFRRADRIGQTGLRQKPRFAPIRYCVRLPLGSSEYELMRGSPGAFGFSLIA